MSAYDFDKNISRQGTFSAKWNCENLTDDQEIISLSVADMDIALPDTMINPLVEHSKKGIYGYTLLSDNWQQVVSHWMLRHYQWQVPPEHVVFCPRVIQAVSLYIQNFTAPGDAIVSLTPSYHPIVQAVTLNQRRLLESTLRYQDGRYSIDFDDLENKFKRASSFILLSPHNPTGTVWPPETLIKIAELAERHQVFIISDDVHADFIFSAQRHQIISTFSDYVAQHSFICTSPAKTFNMAGLEVANIIIANDKHRDKFTRCLEAAGIHNPGYYAVPAFLAAYQHGDAWLAQLKRYLADNRTLLIDTFSRHFPAWQVTRSDGTYMLWVDYRASGLDERQIKTWFRTRAGVEASWGSDFGAAGRGFFRINIATPRRLLSAALQRIVRTSPL
ncbi:MalY/PatB family protein [Serratia rubidaea]|uniref:cysteine-S-conjugate beta-lyase n=1 Tax=Serratia rubidaea TaxID=61652 RepID=A0A3S4X1C3_SERRU|nr:MalY/PatB family protein [Serratia rubidaea]MBH1930743.1 pyridoxal phosphate-dependent aminotransferase [Serratia rubidaea]MDC6116663.1 pyridoxal phosphate-dependent aminotransferase [Serratia rubidaea]MEB7586669.1 pyridoxal phosphate-dependent aminotransferase [Serratia rubidaea]VEI63354.1 Cystathionine beta-lyase PatB [Serratia rubidaea]